MKKKLSKETNCIHTDKKYHGVNTPIFPSTSSRYVGYDSTPYPRYFNTENQDVIVERLCKLENGEAGLIFSSGMAVISSVLLALLKQGDHILLSKEIYGGTFNFIVKEFEKFGIEYDLVLGNDFSEFDKKVKKNTKILYSETPSNPLLTIIDLKAAADFSKSHGLISVVDNTFASPINQNPIDFGIDVVLHSGTKYLSGHSDLSCGAVVTSQAIKDTITKTALNLGGNLNPWDCYILERSLKTLAVRVKEQNRNALKLAEFLYTQSEVKKVNYPGLKDHPGHEIAKAQMTEGFGGMLSFELDPKLDAEKFLSKLDLIAPAYSLGGVETLICQPSKTSHAKMPEDERLKLGITDNLLRVSVGIESIEDIKDDLKQAFML